MVLGISEQTEKTLRHHWQAFGAGDVDEIMVDYADDAVLITRDGTLKGHAQIRSLFSQISENIFPPGSTTVNLAKQIVEGELAYILWSANSAHYNAPFCTDTFLIHDGKIVAQTFAAQMEPK
ncbi:MAG: nuclear transport factor 2 family protein [Acidobacteriaceae bacterium]|nr:nuclear transport factor 2 family protein [Acidobacteriaceae bacterium]